MWGICPQAGRLPLTGRLSLSVPFLGAPPMALSDRGLTRAKVRACRSLACFVCTTFLPRRDENRGQSGKLWPCSRRGLAQSRRPKAFLHSRPSMSLPHSTPVAILVPTRLVRARGAIGQSPAWPASKAAPCYSCSKRQLACLAGPLGPSPRGGGHLSGRPARPSRPWALPNLNEASGSPRRKKTVDHLVLQRIVHVRARVVAQSPRPQPARP